MYANCNLKVVKLFDGCLDNYDMFYFNDLPCFKALNVITVILYPSTNMNGEYFLGKRQ